MINKTLFCITYNGIPIEGFSSSNGYPIFTASDKYVPNLHFQNYESAKSALAYMIVSMLGHNHDQTDMSMVNIGNIQVETKQFAEVSVYDEALTSVLENSYNNAATVEAHVAKIIHLCVRKGFRNILPLRYMEIINEPRFAEVFDKNVPFFVQQNIERFIDVGINTCNPEEIAAIILTSSDELLKAIRIDSLNNVSK